MKEKEGKKHHKMSLQTVTAAFGYNNRSLVHCERPNGTIGSQLKTCLVMLLVVHCTCTQDLLDKVKPVGTQTNWEKRQTAKAMYM